VRVFIAAGERSGERHAAGLLHALRERRSDLEAEGIGGPAMAAAGAHLMARVESLAATGFTEPLLRLMHHRRLLRQIETRFQKRTYDLVVLVDYPGFNLRLARAARSSGLPVLYYIAPQAWAWAEGRTRALARWVNRLAVVLPFEEAFFAARGVAATYVGHPLLDQPYPSRSQARARLALPPEASVLGLLPGSRPGEVGRLWPLLSESAARLRQVRPELHLVVAAVAGCRYEGSRALGARLVWEDSPTVLAAADVVWCKAGTAALEAALLNRPAVTLYRTDPVSYAVARRVVRVPHVNLANLLAGQRAVPELIQRRARPETLLEATHPLFDPRSAEVTAQRHAYQIVRQKLGPAGAAQRTADLALELVA